MPTEVERLARVEEKVDSVVADVAEIKDTLKSLSKDLVTQREFWPVKALVFGFAGLLLVAIVTFAFVNPLTKSSNQTVTITTQNPDGTTTTKTVPAASAPQVVAPSQTPSSTTPGSSSTTTVTNNPPKESPLAKLPLVGGLFQ
jgi:cytoskeletal protein RodZ